MDAEKHIQEKERLNEASNGKLDDEYSYFLGDFPSDRQYEFTTPGSINSKIIADSIVVNKTILHHLSTNKPFRLIIEYRPEELKSKFKIESDHEAPENFKI